MTTADLFSYDLSDSSQGYTLAHYLDYTASDADVTKLLVGKTIESFDYTDTTALFKLSDGTIMKLACNYGGCDCGAGDYEIDSAQLVGGVIMSARQISGDFCDDEGRSRQFYSIFIYTDKVKNGSQMISLTGDDGSGYYGTGYTLDFYVPTH